MGSLVPMRIVIMFSFRLHSLQICSWTSYTGKCTSLHNPPTIDVQEKAGYFFCLEDRAMLCRQCDVTIHTASPYVSSHRRFLITGVRVGLQDKITSNSNNGSSCSNSSNSTLRSAVSIDSIADKMVVEEGVKSQWPWHELLDSLEFDQRYRLSNPGSFS